jgi:hypothetical protein
MKIRYKSKTVASFEVGSVTKCPYGKDPYVGSYACNEYYNFVRDIDYRTIECKGEIK